MPLHVWEQVLISNTKTNANYDQGEMADREGEERESSPEIFSSTYQGGIELEDADDEVLVDEVEEEQGEEFYLPCAKDDLLSTDDSLFVLVSPYSLEEITAAFGDGGGLEDKIRECGGLRVLTDEFASLASSLWRFKTMTPEFFQGVLNGLISAVGLAVDRCNQMQRASPSAKRAFRSNLKVAFYYLCQYLEQLVKQITQNNAGATAKKGGQKHRVESWMGKLRHRALTCITSFTDPSHRWENIWEKSKIDVEVSRLLLVTLFRFCEDVGIASAKSDVHSESDLVIKALANAVSSFHLTDGFLNGILKLFHRHDACGTIAAEVIGRICHKSGNKIISATFRKLEENMDDIAQDNSIGKAYANLLNGLARTYPKSGLLCSDLIDELLKSDAWSVRCACIALLCAGITSYYGSREANQPVTSEDRQAVEFCWDLLATQCLDSTAFVRSKVLHSITELAHNNCITKRKYRIIFEKVLSRSGFGEKTQLVRKAALQCLTALSEIAPEIFQNSLERMQLQLVQEGSLLAQKLPEEIGQEFSKSWIIHSNWLCVQKKIVKAMRIYLTSRSIPSHIEEDLAGKRFDSIMDYICAAIEKLDGETAVYGLLYTAEKFPEKKLIMDYHVQGFMTEFDNDIPPYRMLSLLDCLREVLNRKDQQERKSVKRIDDLLKIPRRNLDDELRSMVSEFRLLQDDIAVRTALTRSIPTWEKVLQMSNKSDIVEISSFLIHIERKGFREAVYNLRGLTNFFASESKEIREAVLNAYREFFIGENANHLLTNVDPLVNKLMRELPCNSALSFHAVRLLFKNEDHRIVTRAAKKLVSTAVTSDGNDDVWRACLALSILPGAADKVIVEKLDSLYPRCLRKEEYDPRLVCTFCDVLIKIGKSPLAKDDITEKALQKVSLDVMHPIFVRLLDICILSFADTKGSAQTQMYGKIVEALFAVSDDPLSTMKHLTYFTMMRLKLNLNRLKARQSGERVYSQDQTQENIGEAAMEVDNAEPVEARDVLPEIQYILYFGATVVFVFGNWIEDIFSVSQDSKGKADNEKRNAAETNENEVDGPSEDDRSKAVVLQIRKSLFESPQDGYGSAVYRISRLIVQLAHTDAVVSGGVGGVIIFMALIRLMLVSEHFCQANMRYLLNVLQTTKSLELKKVLLIGFSDIAVRFVNLVQPHTDSFTNQLRDPNPSIRYHALMAVVRLIVNDLIKIREQQCDIAMLICDSDEKVSTVSRGFFSEKVSKQNVMNVIPQLLDRADMYTRLDQSHVEELLKYLVTLAGKTPTDMEILTETFLEILEASRPVRTWQIAAYGLTITAPQVAEKFSANLRERISSLKKAMRDEVTSAFMTDVLQTVRKKLPDEKKRIADDLIKMVQVMKGTEGQSNRRNRSPRPGTSREPMASDEEDESHGSDSETASEDYAPVKSAKASHRRTNWHPSVTRGGRASGIGRASAKKGKGVQRRKASPKRGGGRSGRK